MFGHIQMVEIVKHQILKFNTNQVVGGDVKFIFEILNRAAVVKVSPSGAQTASVTCVVVICFVVGLESAMKDYLNVNRSIGIA